MSDLLLVSLGTTRGLRLPTRSSWRCSGRRARSVAAVATRIGWTNALRRGYPVNDVVEAVAARRALGAGLRLHRPRALVISTTTAAFLIGDPGVPFAVWLDSPARLNRPGALNAPLHRVERRQLARARVLMPHSPGAVAALPAGAAPSVLIPPPIPAAPEPSAIRQRLVVGYTPDPKAKGLALLCAAWERAALPDVRLLIAGIPPERARAFLTRRGLVLPAGAELVGMLPQPSFRDLLLARARVRQRGGLGGLRDRAARGARPRRRAGRRAGRWPVPGAGPGPDAGARVRGGRPNAGVAGGRAARRRSRPRPSGWRRTGVAARAELGPYRPEASVARLRAEVLPSLLGE